MEKTRKRLLLFLFGFCITLPCIVEAQKMAIDSNYFYFREASLNFDYRSFIETTFSDSEVKVYCVFIDWHQSDTIITFKSFINGETFLVYSYGSEIATPDNISATIRDDGIALVAMGQQFLSIARMSESVDIPVKGYINCYLLTNKGRYIIQEKVSNFYSKNSAILQLLSSGKKLWDDIEQFTKR